MSGTLPVGVYALKVPPGPVMIPAVPGFPAMFRLSMAAIDPTAQPEYEDVDDKQPPRATLKIIRFDPDEVDDSDDDDDSELSEDDDEDEDEDEELNGGPSTKPKVNGTKKSLDDDDDSDADDEAMAKAVLEKLKRGKMKSIGLDPDAEDDDEDMDSEGSMEVEEFVLCTLDPEKNYQQALDMVVGDDERVFFKVIGTHTVYLTGNYVIPADDGQARLYDSDEDSDEYDLTPEEQEELDELDMEDMYGEESDDLDDLEDPRIMEVDDDEEVPKLVGATTGKGKNKRPAEDSDEEANLDDIMAKAMKPADAAAEGEKKLSKSQLKKLKKQKKNDGSATTPEAAQTTAKPTTNGEKKVQFAKELEQGPTPSSQSTVKDDRTSPKPGSSSLGVKTVQGVTIDDRKAGSGPAAKKGDKVSMRYIGKLENGKVFDANKKGKAFSFKLGAGDVIKGWDIGVAGISVGGERRITIPANLGYGSKGAPPDIPPNSKLIFDIKCLEVI